MGILEKIENLEQFRLEHPHCSFIPHMSVFRLDKETTKCRVVYLSNLSDRNSLCHNQTIHSGPNLNKKLTTSLMLLRFDKFVLTFDIKKAFLNIALSELDQCRLLLLWYRNVAKSNFEIVAYKTRRLPFGISCSTALLMLALYKILIIDIEDCSPDLVKFRKLVYSLIYMDNGAYSTDSAEKLGFALTQFKNIFAPYKFFLQQFTTNSSSLQDEIDSLNGNVTPVDTKLFGLIWNRAADTIATKPLN